MTDASSVVERYIASWNERDAERRRALVTGTFGDDAEYIDPLMSGRGIEEIDALIAAAQQQFPGHTSALAAGPDETNDRVRFSWLLAPPDGDPVAGGTDFALLGADGRIQSVTGFLDPVA
jgi:SnoaL-like domain